MADKLQIGLELVEIKRALQPVQQNIVKPSKRMLLAGIAVIMVVSVGLGFMIGKPSNNPVTYRAKAYSYVAEMNPVVSSEINTLKGQFVGLISGSIESKLKVLEHSIRNGSSNTALGTIQDLKNDLQVLRAYSVPRVTDSPNISNEQLIKEISHLRKLIYLTITSCGLMVAAVVGVWFKHRKRLPHPIEKGLRYLNKD